MDHLTQLGRYQIVRVLGRGAMGEVYEGLDPRLNHPNIVTLYDFGEETASPAWSWNWCAARSWPPTST